MEDNQQNRSERSFIPEILIRFKRYVRKRKLLKYGLFGVGTFITVALVLIYYIYYKLDPSVGEKTESSKDSMASPEESSERDKSTGGSRGAGYTDGSKRKEKKLFYGVAKELKNILVTDITDGMTVDSISDVYKERIYSGVYSCKENICGKCSRCMFYNDTDMFSELVARSAECPSVVIYDSIDDLTDFIDGIDYLYSNVSEAYMKYLTEEMILGRIVRIRAKFTSPAKQIDNKAPVFCSILAEGAEGCTVHRFRLQNIERTEEAKSFIETFEMFFRYRGFNLCASLKELCRSIGSLCPGKSVEAVFTADHPEVIENEKSAENISLIPYSVAKSFASSPDGFSNYFMTYVDSNGKYQTDLIGRHKFTHFVSLFGEPRKEVKKNQLLIALSPEPIRKVEGMFDGLLDSLRGIFRSPNKEKKNKEKDIRKYYGTENVYGISILSSLCRWKYTDSDISLSILARNKDIERVTVCGVSLDRLCTVDEALNLFSLFDQAIILNDTPCAEFIQRARDTLSIMDTTPEKSMCISIEQTGNLFEGAIRIYEADGSKSSEIVYLFSLPSKIIKALCKNTKEPWICTFMQSFAFAVAERVPDLSKALPETVSEGDFLGSYTQNNSNNSNSQKIDRPDVLDRLYSYLNDNKSIPVKYVLLLVGDSLFLKMSRKKESAIETIHYAYTHKDISESLRRAINSNMSFGIFTGRDLVAWSSTKVAYDTYSESLKNTLWNIVDYAYYRLYFAARPVLNSIRKGNGIEISLSLEEPKFKESFFEWLMSLGRFSTLALSHPVLPIVLDAKKGGSLDITVEMVEKSVKPDIRETGCKINVICGGFKEKVPLEFIELGKDTSSSRKNEKLLRYVFTRILNLSKISDSPTEKIRISVETFPNSPRMLVNVTEEKEQEVVKIGKFKVDLDAVKKNAKALATEVGDISNANIPVLTNGNIGVLLAIID